MGGYPFPGPGIKKADAPGGSVGQDLPLARTGLAQSYRLKIPCLLISIKKAGPSINFSRLPARSASAASPARVTAPPITVADWFEQPLGRLSGAPVRPPSRNGLAREGEAVGLFA